MNNDLHRAAEDGSVSRTEVALLEESIDINRGNPRGLTPLMLAAHRGFPQVTKMFLDAGADVEIMSDFGSALHLSLMSKHLAVTTQLMKAGADVEAICPSGHKPIHSAALAGWLEGMGVLIDAGADVDAETEDDKLTSLHFAAGRGDVEVVRMLLGAGANPLLLSNDESKRKPGGLVMMFIPWDHGIRPPNTNGWGIPLDRAATQGNDEVVRELLEQVGIEGCGGQTGGLNALGAAAMKGHLDLIGIFAAAGVVDTGRVLAAAAGAAKQSSVRCLLQQYGTGTAIEKAAYINNTRDVLGRTPLASAVSGYGFYGSCRVVRTLLDHGANVAAAPRAENSLWWVDELRGTKEVDGGLATEEQMQRLEGIYRLLLQEDAVHATSWLWPTEVAGNAGVAEGGSVKTKNSATPLITMLPVLRRRATRARVLLTALSR